MTCTSCATSIPRPLYWYGHGRHAWCWPCLRSIIGLKTTRGLARVNTGRKYLHVFAVSVGLVVASVAPAWAWCQMTVINDINTGRMMTCYTCCPDNNPYGQCTTSCMR